MPAAKDLLPRLVPAFGKFKGERPPGVAAYARPDARADPLRRTEAPLVGHVHLDEAGLATLVEGFGGAAGERFAEEAYDALFRAGALAEGAELRARAAPGSCPTADAS